jgi:hypothetical protein
VTTEYRASGQTAVLIAQVQALDREDRELERYEARAQREPIEAVERTLVDYFVRVEDVAHSALYAAGVSPTEARMEEAP